MKRSLAMLTVILLTLLFPRPAQAKSSTVKITISGGDLSKTIEVDDSQILDASNIWSGKFLDRTRGTAKKLPEGLRRYEVSFYIRGNDNGLARRYVLYYYPSTTDPGYIYLPGKGETWYWLNVAAILREGRDGNWNYASPAWESLIKSVISRAESASANH
jgi:hypothetical protein